MLLFSIAKSCYYNYYATYNVLFYCNSTTLRFSVSKLNLRHGEKKIRTYNIASSRYVVFRLIQWFSNIFVSFDRYKYSIIHPKSVVCVAIDSIVWAKSTTLLNLRQVIWAIVRGEVSVGRQWPGMAQIIRNRFTTSKTPILKNCRANRILEVI